MKAVEKNQSLKDFLMDYSIDDWLEIWKVLKSYTNKTAEELENQLLEDSESFKPVVGFDKLAEDITNELQASSVKNYENMPLELDGDILFNIINDKHGFNDLYSVLFLGF